jgi:hypothetical protein
MRKSSSLSRLVLAGFALGCFLLCVSTANAQSGRRGSKPTPAPTATPEPVPATPSNEKEEKTTVTFIIGVNKYLGFSSIPLPYYDTVVRGCAERLDDLKGVKIEIVREDMSRADAVRKAQAQKDAFTVWLQIKAENVNGDPGNVTDLSQLYLEYTVFAPTTAKSVTWGHTYQQGYRKGDVVVGPPGKSIGNVAYSEYLMKQAASEAGERILNALKMGKLPTNITWRD